MKNLFLIILLFYTFNSFTQEKVVFPFKVKLKNAEGKKISTKSFNNLNGPLVLVFVDPMKVYHKDDNKAKLDHSLIFFLNSLNKTINTWKKRFNAKVRVVFHKDEIENVKVNEIATRNNWSFQYFFNENKKLFKKIKNDTYIKNHFTIIFDTNFNEVYSSKESYQKNYYCYIEKDKSWKQYYLDINNKRVDGNWDLKVYNRQLELMQ